MPAEIVRGASGQPGMVGYPNGIDSGIFNELNYVIPDYRPKLLNKYGNESLMLTMMLTAKDVLEETNTSTNTFSHFEKGRIFGSALVNANVTGVTSGANVTLVLKSPQSYNDGATGTQSAFVENRTVVIRSNGRKATVVSVNRTTAGAFSVVLKPLGSYALISGTTGTTLSAGEGLDVYENQLAGEASDSQQTWSPKIYRYDNTCTVSRASVKTSDLVSMNKTQVDFGGSNYQDMFAVKTMNLSMLASMENGFLDGVPSANTTSTGTIGVIPAIEARGSEVDYLTTASIGVDDIQRLTAVWDYNGGPAEYQLIQDIKQRQAFNKSLFGLYPNGAITYANVGASEEAAVSLGFKSFSTDTYTLHFYRYKAFSAGSQFGYIPTIGDYRANFGIGVPLGNVQDAKQNVSRPFMQLVFQQNPDLPKGQRIYAWELGYTKQTKTSKAENKYEQIAYYGSRVIAAEQFSIIRGVAS